MTHQAQSMTAAATHNPRPPPTQGVASSPDPYRGTKLPAQDVGAGSQRRIGDVFSRPPDDTALNQFNVRGPFDGLMPKNIGAKFTTSIMSIAGAGVGFVGITGGLWKLAEVFGKRPELAAQAVGPYAGLSAAFVGAAVGFSFGAWVLRNSIDNQIRGKLDLRKQSFDDPDEMYEHLKDVRNVIFETMGIPNRFAKKIDHIIEGRQESTDTANQLQDRIRRLPRIPSDLAEEVVRDIYGTGYFGDNLQLPPHGLMDPELKVRWDAYLHDNPTARPIVEDIIAEDTALRNRLDAEKEMKSRLIREVMKQIDCWQRPPLGMRAVVNEIKELPLTEDLRLILLDNYLPGHLKDKIGELRIKSSNFRDLYEAEVKDGSKAAKALAAIFEKDDRLRPLSSEERAEGVNRRSGDVGLFGALVEGAFGRFGVRFPMRRTLGLAHKDRREDEGMYERPKWYLIRRPRPYTSTPFNPKLWGREEFDLGKRAEIFVTALNNVFRQKVVFRGVGELTQSNIKGLIANELEGLKLQAEERQLSIHGHRFIAKGFQDQLAERYNYVFMKIDNLFQTAFSKDNAARTGGILVGAPIVIGIASRIAGVAPWSFWQTVNPIVRPIMDALF